MSAEAPDFCFAEIFSKLVDESAIETSGPGHDAKERPFGAASAILKGPDANPVVPPDARRLLRSRRSTGDSGPGECRHGC
jgi:hypothetical protein